MKPGRCDSFNSGTVLILLGLFFLFCVSLEPRVFPVLNDNDWDLLIFTQNWPNSVCLKWREKSPNSTCNVPIHDNEWTIHGIWPTKLGTLGPWFCDPTRPFNMEGIYGIMDRLEEQWMRVENHKKKFAFWKHEWEKHGTCAAELKELSTEFLYFYQGLIWNDLYNITDILRKAKLPPGSTPTAQQVIDGVHSVLGVNPFVSCYTEPKTKETYLLEVRLCFNKSLAVTDCDGVRGTLSKGSWRSDSNSSILTDCPKDAVLLYPLQIPPPPPPPKPHPTSYKILKLLSFVQWVTL